MEYNNLIKNKAPETVAVLESIPSWILRWGILIMTMVVTIVIISSIKLINFQYKFSTKAHVESEALVFKKNVNDDIDIEKIEYILVGEDSKRLRINDILIVSDKKNIIIKISPDYLNLLNEKEAIKIEVFQKKSLLEIIMGDIN